MLPLVWLAGCAAVLRYVGGVFGVRADVHLNLSNRVATVRLRGAPLGGRVQGNAHFDADGGLVLSDGLSSALRRRAVRVEHAGVDADMRMCWVTAQLPIVGAVNITLDRVVEVDLSAGPVC